MTTLQPDSKGLKREKYEDLLTNKILNGTSSRNLNEHTKETSSSIVHQFLSHTDLKKH